MINELRKSIARLEKWEELADKALEAWEADPMDEDREKTLDHYYELEWNEWTHAVNILARFIGTEEKTARQMLNRGNREKLVNILKLS